MNANNSIIDNISAKPMLGDLLAGIHSRQAALPEFQRDFVWDPRMTQSLIISIAKQYPAGSILRVRNAKPIFAYRNIEGAPPLGDAVPVFLVLDGQQRLTSLYQAFYGVGEHRYYLDLAKLRQGEDLEDAMFHLRTKTKEVKALEACTSQDGSGQVVVPLSAFRQGKAGIVAWIATTKAIADDARAEWLHWIQQDDQVPWASAIDKYEFPVVTLLDHRPDALCSIFETLNSTGVRLSAFELLTARFWVYQINLRDLWKQAKSDFPIIEEFKVDPFYVLQAICLASGRFPSCRSGDVMKLGKEDIDQWWGPTVAALATAIRTLREHCSVVLPKWLPYQTVLVPMSAVMAKLGKVKGPEAGVHIEKIKQWFWCSVFGQAYESAANTQAARDAHALERWLTGGEPPETVSQLRFDPNCLRDVTPRQRAIYQGVICLIIGNGALDFFSQQKITGKLIEEEGVDDHHVFPFAYLEQEKNITNTTRRNCVLNRTLIDRSTNRTIGKRDPADYLTEIRSKPSFPLDAVLTSHLLPTGDNSSLMQNDYDAFLAWRQEQLWSAIRKVTGLKHATDLEVLDSDD